MVYTKQFGGAVGSNFVISHPLGSPNHSPYQSRGETLCLKLVYFVVSQSKQGGDFMSHFYWVGGLGLI